MRDRPFIQAGEQPRPFSEVRLERVAFDPARDALEQIHELEAEARELIVDGEVCRSIEVQGQAEALRCQIYHFARGRTG